MPDVEIPCVQCKEIFVFSEKDQEAYYQRNMMTPQRCTKCRSKKAAIREDAPKRFEIVCDIRQANLGRDTHKKYEF